MLFCNLNFSGSFSGEENKALENEEPVSAADETKRHRKIPFDFCFVQTLYPIPNSIHSKYVQLHSDLNITYTGVTTDNLSI